MSQLQSFALPDVGEGLTEADIVQWHVAVGDRVEVNQTIVEIETAKSLVELPCPWEGVVAELLVTVGATVDVGTPLLTITPLRERVADDGERVVDGGERVADGGERVADQAPEPQQAVLVGYGTATSAPVRRRRTHVPDETLAPVGDPTPSGSPLAKPPVRALARELGIALETVTPSGPGGIVTSDDVLARVRSGEPRSLATYPGDDTPWLADGVVTADGRQTRVPVRSVRRRTAEAMVASAFTAPHVTVFQTVDVTRTIRLVEDLRADREFADVRVTPLLVAAKALILAIRRHPEISAAWDAEAEQIVYKHYINLGIAAATPRGLVVPNIKNAHSMSLRELAQQIADLTRVAREGRTTPQAMQDGTVTVTNVGVFGIDTGTPILNPGESAILAFGAITRQPWVHKGKVKPRWVTQLAFSFDHRLVDGELGARVLSDVARVLEDPARGLVWG